MRQGIQSVLLQAVRRWLAVQARRRVLADEAGNALIELALVLSLLGIPLLTGTIYFGELLLDSTIVTNAQEEATGLGVTLNVTPTMYYACSTAIGGTTYSTQVAANTACTGGTSHSLQFIKVATSATVTPAYAFAGLSKTVTLNSVSVQEVEE